MNEQLLKRLHARGADLEQERELAGDVMNLLHLVHGLSLRDERRLEARMLDEHFDEGSHRSSDRTRVHYRDIASDDAGVLELPHSLVDRRSRESDALGDLRLRELAVALEQTDDLSVFGVQNNGSIRHDGHMCE